MMDPYKPQSTTHGSAVFKDRKQSTGKGGSKPRSGVEGSNRKKSTGKGGMRPQSPID